MKYIIANWKMNMSINDTVSWCEYFIKNENKIDYSKNEIIVAPALIHISLVKELMQGTKVKISAQDVSVFDKGAHTGEVGAFQATEYCTYSIIGHSERNEDRELVKYKLDKCLQESLTPIICFNDSKNASNPYDKTALMAWEDPGNISQGGSYKDIEEETIKNEIRKISQIVQKEQFIYGGSVNRQNIQLLAKIGELNGVLVGNASLDPDHFIEIAINSNP